MYLGIDLGNKKCGLAVEIQGIVIPKQIVPRTKIIKTISKYIKDYNVNTIVVGLPYDLYGKDLRQLDKTKKFIEKLKDIYPNIHIEGIDERFTSIEADSYLKSGKGAKDDIAAGLILESYLALKERR